MYIKVLCLGDFILNEIDKLFELVINNGYCIGCGNCAAVENSPLIMYKNNEGKFIPKLKDNNYNNEISVLSVCPFFNDELDEDIIAENLYRDSNKIKHNEYTGYYINNYAGYVKDDQYRMSGSSGGMGTWITAKLLEKDLVDGIIHVKEDEKDNDTLFSYQVSESKNELFEGSKSKYYPIEMSKVIKYIQNNPGNYAVVGIPCFIKAIRLISEGNKEINERIKYTIGLVCGHLKSDYFAKSIGWELGIKPENLTNIDFRVKYEDKQANKYGVKVNGLINNKKVEKEAVSSSLYVTNWGHGLFKYKACDYCDDVLAETADITIGDAWLPEYVKDNKGTNIITVRDSDLNEIIKDNNELYLDKLSIKEIFQSQAGGFRHRREALAYRLFLDEKDKKWHPPKRIEASNKGIKNKRKEIYEKRIELYQESFNAYKKALEDKKFKNFIEYMNPYIKNYNKLIKKPLIYRFLAKFSFLRKIKRIVFN